MSRKWTKGRSSGGGLSEAAAPGGGPKYAHASKERRGAAERKKNQERKSQESGKRYKRDLNTQAARGPANFDEDLCMKLLPLYGQ